MAKASAAANRKRELMLTLEAALERAVKGVFGTIVFMKVDATASEEPIEGERYAGWVAFSGDLPGVLMVHVGVQRAREITATILGLPPKTDPRPEAVREAIVEVCSQVADRFKTALSADGPKLTATLPTVAFGSDFGVSPGSRADRCRLGFQCEGEPLTVEFYLWGTSAD